jgi:UDP-N-acetylmuramoyl-tripeptide--D-alanyl-D-alanine ligase
MRELGQAATAAHELIGRRAREVFDEIAIVDAGHGRLLAQAAGAALVADKPAVARWARDHARPGDVVLVKASHGVGLQEVVREIVGRGQTDLLGADSCP